ncbi:MULTISPECIES: aldo/keto reductase [unclassified Solwaraspora]|uniref:aldo/keto reductase n=1 Tax=unclassified Solwaraspora TaxID=2627926 RepID=UPI00248AD365|nr:MULTISPECIES: aldo/keto reductase [unclassified Solwaraspora]WBB99463.1 aldo/keto reductase [Solwaraspora sp. WMMA2059]WBC21987.1 aldo/keto reductase [Solwaraspora sp. WMMA2080]WJK35966.1 aldo/keto reductase [Solwaraspora sp. WMMA2065]
MQQRPLGRSGLAVSRLALGTMTWGRDTDADDAAAQLKSYLDAGGNLIDTADVYGDGDAEAVIGSLLDSMVPREDLVIATKAGLRPGGPRRRDTSRWHLLRTLDASLRRLGTDYIDLWQVHGYDPDTPMEETLGALDTAVTSGRVRYVGVSNFSGWQTARAAAWQAAVPGRAAVVAAQVEYSLLQRGIEREVLPACAALGLGVLPWSPLGRGVLTGKYRHGRPVDSRAASPHLELFVATYLEPRCSSIVEAVSTAAAGLGVAPLEVALAWVRDRPGVTAPILGARTAGQLLGALQVERMTLPTEITRALDDVSAPPVGYPERDG